MTFSYFVCQVGVFGYSAGGHLATTITTHSESDFGLTSHDAIDETNGQPDFLGLGYPVISMALSSNSRKHLLNGYAGTDLENLKKSLSGEQNVTPQMPPVFLFTSLDDEVISPQNSVLFQRALEAAKVPAEVHLFQHGKHGAGLATDHPEEKVWPELFHQWLLRNYFLSKQK
ncbi:hypothetical protein BV898_04169 [Hypsibius exemplaris]|uniref:BD-FAE-like domain-containing protein n=1 Tax=Hypsibius exemplaris TaxID=2072580 RepID=A0A1W0X3F6_HYPEX|nr:hypothetical protein BV898_04169 [Hypsibius exemplaris]